MATPEFSDDLYKANFEEQMRYHREKMELINRENKKILANYKTTKVYNDYKKGLQKHCEVLKGNETLHEKTTQLEADIEKLRVWNDKATAKIDKYKNLNEDLSKSLDKARLRASDIDRIAEYFGFQVQLKEENVYTIHFMQLPIKNPDIKFEFDVLENSNKVKVLKINPNDCIETTEFEDKINLESATPGPQKFVALVLWIRQKLIEKYL